MPAVNQMSSYFFPIEIHNSRNKNEELGLRVIPECTPSLAPSRHSRAHFASVVASPHLNSYKLPLSSSPHPLRPRQHSLPWRSSPLRPPRTLTPLPAAASSIPFSHPPPFLPPSPLRPRPPQPQPTPITPANTTFPPRRQPSPSSPPLPMCLSVNPTPGVLPRNSLASEKNRSRKL